MFCFLLQRWIIKRGICLSCILMNFLLAHHSGWRWQKTVVHLNNGNNIGNDYEHLPDITIQPPIQLYILHSCKRKFFSVGTWNTFQLLPCERVWKAGNPHRCSGEPEMQNLQCWNAILKCKMSMGKTTCNAEMRYWNANCQWKKKTACDVVAGGPLAIQPIVLSSTQVAGESRLKWRLHT